MSDEYRVLSAEKSKAESFAPEVCRTERSNAIRLFENPLSRGDILAL
jgi:hypothetical protein